MRTTNSRLSRHKKVLKAAKGFKQSRSRRYKVAREAVLHAGQYAFAGRRLKKRDLKKLWIIRLNAAVREHDLTYSKFSAALKASKVEINHKLLADIAVNDPDAFSQIVSSVKSA
ncbi:MAG: 50S ribosomal protein L20 [bacterium]|nr:50S ribosomal protein L20 [bacterium]